jgi:hypothetical protein
MLNTKKYLIYKISGGLNHMLMQINNAIHLSKITNVINGLGRLVVGTDPYKYIEPYNNTPHSVLTGLKRLGRLPLKKNKNKVGVDLGINSLATLSNGKKYKNIRSYKTAFSHRSVEEFQNYE